MVDISRDYYTNAMLLRVHRTLPQIAPIDTIVASRYMMAMDRYNPDDNNAPQEHYAHYQYQHGNSPTWNNSINYREAMAMAVHYIHPIASIIVPVAITHQAFFTRAYLSLRNQKLKMIAFVIHTVALFGFNQRLDRTGTLADLRTSDPGLFYNVVVPLTIAMVKMADVEPDGLTMVTVFRVLDTNVGNFVRAIYPAIRNRGMWSVEYLEEMIGLLPPLSVNALHNLVSGVHYTVARVLAMLSAASENLLGGPANWNLQPHQAAQLNDRDPFDAVAIYRGPANW
jgi:hypothetical protein